MLSIVPIRGDGTYYTSVGRDDYYLSGGEPPGIWLGAGAAIIGLMGKVEPAVYRKLMGGFAPDGVTALVRNAGTQNRKPGWDLTFSVPKSVSEWFAAAAADDSALDKAFRLAVRRAVEKTISRLEDVAAFGREGFGGTEHVKLKLIVAGFEHRSSRNYDPQIHWHCVVVNAGITEAGESRSVVSKYLFRFKMAAGALFRAELAHELRTTFGLELEAKSTWFEIAGVPQSLIDAGSSRRKEILAHREKSGYTSAKAAEIAALETRRGKVAMPAELLSKRWKEVAAEHGLDRNAALRLLNRTDRSPAAINLDLVSYAIQKVLESQSFLSERDLIRAVAERVQSIGANSTDLIAKVRSGLKNLVPLGNLGREAQFTTQEMLDLEKRILARTHLGRLSMQQLIDRKRIFEIAAEHNLSQEQINALLHVANRPGNTQIVQGLAGTGKSTLFKAARIAFEESGFKVLGLSLSGKAAEGLEQSSGIESFTIASALHHWKSELSSVPRLDSKAVLVVDEASMVGTRQLDELFAHADAAGAKVVLVGDRKQLPAIAAGAPFVSLSEQLGVARLTDIKRQVSEWGRTMVREFAEGSVKVGIDALNERGLIFVGENREKASHRLLMDWSQESDLKEVLILASTHEDVSWINRRAQKIRLESGFLTGLPFKSGEQTFFAGERIIFGKNDRKIGVKNGTFGTIRGVAAGSIVVDLDTPGKRVFVPANYQKMKLGYAITSHKAQGVTVNKSYVLFSDSLQSRELTYVQVSRARQSTKLFLSKDQAGDLKLTHAVRTVERSCAKLNAGELASRKINAYEQGEKNPNQLAP